jgi:gamma-glutamyl:cysteine ligase YbdK (ATP-grasp superfamily)
MTPYKMLEVLGPEHEYSIVNDELKPLPIVDKILKGFRGRIVNSVELSNFTVGKELQLHVMEIKPNAPFASPEAFEETMCKAVTDIKEHIERKYDAHLLGMGMHPLLTLDEARIWPHRHRQIYEAYSKIFDLKRHGWLNIQSFQLNLPYSNEKDGVLQHNLLSNLCPFLAAIASASPIYEGKLGSHVDNRLHFYMENQQEIRSVSGDVVPEYVSSLAEYRKQIIDRYSFDLAKARANKCILNKDWVNSRGVIFRFDRKALEIRVMDEQECVKSDVALSCFIRAVLRGFVKNGETKFLPHETIVKNLKSVIKYGLKANVNHPAGRTARKVCHHLLKVAFEHADAEEKKYLPLVARRIEAGSLSEIVRQRVQKKAQKTCFREAVVSVYLDLMKNLNDNRPYL